MHFTLKKGCIGYLAYIVGIEKDEVRLEDVHFVRDYADVFPKEFPGIHLEREVKFSTEVLPDTSPISMEPYRMAPADLKELKIQLQELLEDIYSIYQFFFGSSSIVCLEERWNFLAVH
ncbi:hypothetical protein LIER_32213 [Lithospermum erythrorhizon]|uniref:Cellular nucleic acid-binding protein n=1 Tax=Lithospermum erythrorhizon TaxID=34254 RepID=A0AAV3RWN6_LITER